MNATEQQVQEKQQQLSETKVQQNDREIPQRELTDAQLDAVLHTRDGLLLLPPQELAALAQTIGNERMTALLGDMRDGAALHRWEPTEAAAASQPEIAVPIEAAPPALWDFGAAAVLLPQERPLAAGPCIVADRGAESASAWNGGEMLG